jgi:hypothetical protein
MRYLGKLTLAVAVSTFAGATASAQTTTATGSGTTTGAASGGGTSTGLGGSATPTALGDSSLATPAINALVGPGTVPTALNQSNILGGYYANPYYQGRPSSATIAPGGFGAALYGSAGGGTGGAGGFPSATGNTINSRSGTTSGMGAATGGGTFGTTGAGGRTQQGGGQQGGAGNQSGIVIPLPRQISYTATLSFKAPVATVPQMATDLRATLDRSTMLGNPRGVTLAMDGGVVVLSGNVASDDEVRLVEGMVRLTPGVRDVRNELKVGPPTP